jgi:oligopeptidase A
LIEKLRKAKHFNAALMVLRQLKFGMVDMALHSEFDPTDSSESIWDVQQRISKQTQHYPEVTEDRFLCQFQHIFSSEQVTSFLTLTKS